jgi:hypothetical protein
VITSSGPIGIPYDSDAESWADNRTNDTSNPVASVVVKPAKNRKERLAERSIHRRIDARLRRIEKETK